MQINSLRIKAYRSWTVDETTPPDASVRIRKLEIVARLRGEGCSMPTALEVIGWSRATYYRWRYGMKGRRPGEPVQLDHMPVRLPDGSKIKEFKAVCPVSKQMVSRVYTRATAHNPKRFLETQQAELPIPLRSLQVDGGGEFVAEFEQACRKAPIPSMCCRRDDLSTTAASSEPTQPPETSSTRTTADR